MQLYGESIKSFSDRSRNILEHEFNFSTEQLNILKMRGNLRTDFTAQEAKKIGIIQEIIQHLPVFKY
jgi:hypothetical protein